MISEEDENVSENSSTERTRKESDGSNSENLNSKPEADQLEMKTYPSSGGSAECVLQCSECEPQDDVDGVTFAPLPVMTKCQDVVENEFENEGPKEIPNLPSMTTDNSENEFEQIERKLPTLRIIRILGGMVLALTIVSALLCPFGMHYVAKEHKKSYLYYKIDNKGGTNDGVDETHIIQVKILLPRLGVMYSVFDDINRN